jgi:hypothetical protein
MLRCFPTRSLPITKQLTHGWPLLPVTAAKLHHSLALANRRPSDSVFSRNFASGSKKVYQPCAGAMFQHGFGSHMAVVGFLNDLLGLDGKNKMASVEYVSGELPPKTTLPRAGRSFVFDLKCRSIGGGYFFVRMYSDFRPNLERMNALDLLHMQQDLFETYKITRRLFWAPGEIQGSYIITVTNKASKVEPGWKPLLVDRYEFRHTMQLDRHFGDTICQVVLFDVDNLNKTSANDLVSPIEQWAYVFQDSKLSSGTAKIAETKTIDGIDSVIDKNPGIKEFVARILVDAVPKEVLKLHSAEINNFNKYIKNMHKKAIQIEKEED